MHRLLSRPTPSFESAHTHHRTPVIPTPSDTHSNRHSSWRNPISTSARSHSVGPCDSSAAQNSSRLHDLDFASAIHPIVSVCVSAGPAEMRIVSVNCTARQCTALFSVRSGQPVAVHVAPTFPFPSRHPPIFARPTSRFIRARRPKKPLETSHLKSERKKKKSPHTAAQLKLHMGAKCRAWVWRVKKARSDSHLSSSSSLPNFADRRATTP